MPAYNIPVLITLPWILDVFVFAFVILPENSEAELILPVFNDKELTFAATPTFPPMPTLPVSNEFPLTPRVAVLIEPVLLMLPVLLIFTEVKILPKSSLPTNKLPI